MKNSILFFIFFLLGIGVIVIFFPKNIKNTPITVSILPSVVPTTSFSIENPPPDSLKGKIASMSGIVQWESRIASQPATIDHPISIQQGERLVTDKDGEAIVIFNDAAIINLSSESDISFTQTLPAQMVLMQEKGIVEYEKKGDTPLSIRSGHIIVMVKEGSLKLEMDKENAQTIIDIIKGSATVGYNDADYISQVIPLKEGDHYIFDEATLTSDIQ